jgi:uncharacterized protein (DUF1501 family)
MNTRRDFLKLASLAGAGRFGAMNALAQGTDYKALVGIFLFGGCDANNVVVPQASSDYTAYKTIRGSVGLPDNSATLLPVTAANGTPYALSSGFQPIHPLWAQGSLAAVANVGMLVQPTTRAQFLSGAVPVQQISFPIPTRSSRCKRAPPIAPAAAAGRAASPIRWRA